MAGEKKPSSAEPLMCPRGCGNVTHTKGQWCRSCTDAVVEAARKIIDDDITGRSGS